MVQMITNLSFVITSSRWEAFPVTFSQNSIFQLQSHFTGPFFFFFFNAMNHQGGDVQYGTGNDHNILLTVNIFKGGLQYLSMEQEQWGAEEFEKAGIGTSNASFN